jgi:hypothetical protein
MMATVELVKFNKRRKNIDALRATVSYTNRGDGETVESGDTHELVAIPANAIITAVYVNVKTAFDTAGGPGSATADVTDGTVTYINDVDLTATGVTAYSGGAIAFSARNTIDFVPTLTGATTTGEVEVIVEFIGGDDTGSMVE